MTVHEAVTLSEINSQPEVWKRCLEKLDHLNLEPLVANRSPYTHKWVFVGCGTSYYLAQAAAATCTELTGTLASAVPASEMLLFSGLISPDKNALVFPILISRSGHTSEVLRVAEMLKQAGIEFMAITCDGRELEALTPRTLKVPTEESSIVMTSSFTSMLMSLQYLLARMAKREDFIDALHLLSAELNRLLPVYAPQIETFAQVPVIDVAFLAQGPLYAIASETALKVMESSSTYAQFFHTLEFRHGPKSVVSENVLVGTLISDTGYAEESAVLREMKELNGRTIAIANHITPEVAACADLAIELALPVPELARLVIYVVWGQLLGSYIGLHKGMNPDAPRHLNRVVTIAE
jgi:glutamine---fructose-6-phosphate transaminase (isomerizing)